MAIIVNKFKDNVAEYINYQVHTAIWDDKSHAKQVLSLEICTTLITQPTMPQARLLFYVLST